MAPYKSQAQEKYFNANRNKLESQGVNVTEWNQASKGKKLSKRAKKLDRNRKPVTMRRGKRK